MCNFQQFYCVWGIGSNCWINAVISYELHKMLKYSQQMRRYSIPSNTKVTLQALVVYTHCAFLAAWGLLEKDNFPHHTLPVVGLACLPVEIDRQSSFFFWFVFFPLFCGIPIAYVLYAAFDIWRKKLLPPNGKRRLLTQYFGRIILIFLLMWLPFLIITYALAPFMPMWVNVAGGAISHMQGPASAGMALMKPDVMLAFKNFLRCQCGPCAPDNDNDDVYENAKPTVFRTSFFDRMKNAIDELSRSMRDSTIDTLAISEKHDRIWPDQDRGDSHQPLEQGKERDLEESKVVNNPLELSQKPEEDKNGTNSVKFEEHKACEDSFRSNP